MIYVASGHHRSNTTFVYENHEVFNFTIHKKFDPSTMEHNLALIRLRNPLNLYNNTNIQLINLDDGKVPRTNCFITVQNQNSSVLDDYYQTVDRISMPPILSCNRSADYTIHHGDDSICSQYQLRPMWCNNLNTTQFQFHPDRGASLICNNFLVGLLGRIILPDMGLVTNCDIKQNTFALYSPVEENLEWIRENMGLDDDDSRNHKNSTTSQVFSLTFVALLTIVSLLANLL